MARIWMTRTWAMNPAQYGTIAVSCDLRSRIWIAKAILFIWGVPTGRCESGNGLVLSFRAESKVDRSNGKLSLGKGCMVNNHVNLCRAVNCDRRKWMTRLNQKGMSTRRMYLTASVR